MSTFGEFSGLNSDTDKSRYQCIAIVNKRGNFVLNVAIYVKEELKFYLVKVD